jgi:hypothetical protein
VFRALCLLRSQDFSAVGLAHAWLQGYEADPAERTALGFKTPPPAPVEVVRGMCWIMALSGPTLVAVDQIDGIIDTSRLAGGDGLEPETSLTEMLSAGLLELSIVCDRSMTVVTCLPESWARLGERTTGATRHRFTGDIYLRGMSDRTAAAALIVGRMRPACLEAGFTPPFPSWPYSEAAIAAAAEAGMMPRTILMRCEGFRRACLAEGRVSLCDDLTGRIEKVDRDTSETLFDLAGAKARAEIGDLLDGEARHPPGQRLRRVEAPLPGAGGVEVPDQEGRPGQDDGEQQPHRLPQHAQPEGGDERQRPGQAEGQHGDVGPVQQAHRDRSLTRAPAASTGRRSAA